MIRIKIIGDTNLDDEKVKTTIREAIDGDSNAIAIALTEDVNVIASDAPGDVETRIANALDTVKDNLPEIIESLGLGPEEEKKGQ